MKRVSLGLAVLFAACSPNVKTITVQPPNVLMGMKGQNVVLKATAKDEQGTVLNDPGIKFAYTSSDPAVVTADETGKLTAVKSGSASITVAFKQVQAAVPVNVAIPGSIELKPLTSDILGAGQVTVIRAMIKDDANRPMPSVLTTWVSSDAKVAQVAGGRVTSIGAGTATITAALPSGIKAMATINVKIPDFAKIVIEPAKGACKPGAPLQLTAKAVDSKYAPVAGVGVLWSSSDTKIATVTTAGLVMAVAPGAVKITAKSGEKSTTVPVTVGKK